MNRSLPVMFLGVALIIFGMYRADAAAPGAAKIGFVDLEQTLSKTKAGKQAQKKFDAEKTKKQNALDVKQKQLQRDAAELDRKRMVLKPEVLKAKQQELQKQYVELQETYVTLERELGQARVKLIQKILQKAEPVIKQIAQRQGYTLILDRGAVVWAHDGVDITAEVNKKLN